ncbi:glycoside hydrolase family 127 protein [Gracilimonas mengyeensis]|uniref:Glycosyl hydrolase n=1 Tax=Gracilimonas mengyeensis TaxID=1302730 RepID=A0A521AY80_9BACT|nr:glycoside hydrolase family 127 protein [Gracilimonas mengyeensis]SMO39797.1 hypothetical protein SAMN06265219_101439 [Gracilimonas mengyeensis]
MKYTNKNYNTYLMNLWWRVSIVALAMIVCNSTLSKAQDGDDSQVKYQLFSLSDVQLLDSPFKSAMELNGKYLLKLDADRLLAPFLKEAGLDPKAPNYGGWEEQGEMGDGLDGHSLGHYVSALSMIYAATGKQEFGERLDYVVNELRRSQEAIGTGYVGGVPNGEEILNEVRTGKIEAEPFALNGSWVPWYNLHKLFAGLRDAYLYADNEAALDILVELSDWTVEWANSFSEEQFQEILKTEFGGMKEVMADLYAITQEEKYVELSRKFTDHSIFEPLADNEDRLAGLHANTQIPKVIGDARLYEVSGDTEMKEAAEFFWKTVTENHTYVNGGNSDGEHFGPPKIKSERLSKSSSETCNTYNMLKLTQHLSRWSAHPQYADYYERALYNHILASQDPQTGMFAYYISMEPGYHKIFSTPYDSFWCCVGSGMENHTKYGRYIYMHGQDELFVNLFIPSQLDWEEKGVRVIQETSFPKSESSTFTIHTDEPKEFSIMMRRPYWAGEDFAISVNGNSIEIGSEPSSYIEIARIWKNGDTIEVTLPMETRTESLSGDENTIAFMHGPILLAGIVGEEIPIQSQYAHSEQYEYFSLPTVDVPDLQPQTNSVQGWVEGTSEPLQFTLTNVGDANDIRLAPFYEVNHDHYTIYWNLDEKD